MTAAERKKKLDALREQWKAIKTDNMHGEYPIDFLLSEIDRQATDITKKDKALRKILKDCPLSCLEGDCGAEWEMELKPCPICVPLREAFGGRMITVTMHWYWWGAGRSFSDWS